MTPKRLVSFSSIRFLVDFIPVSIPIVSDTFFYRHTHSHTHYQPPAIAATTILTPALFLLSPRRLSPFHTTSSFTS